MGTTHTISQTKMLESKLCLEDLSNEVFMEIFDYLRGQHIVLAFSHLNDRFNSVCTHYSNYHIDTSNYFSLNKKELNQLLDSIYTRYIRSLTFFVEQYIQCIPVKYLSSLCSLIFLLIMHPAKIKQFLEKLPSPRQLRYLSIDVRYCHDGLQDLYLTISKLPNLCRLEFHINSKTFRDVMINQLLLSVKHISFSCDDLDNFIQLVPFMTNLISLKLSFETYNPHPNYSNISSNYLSKLKFLQMSKVERYLEIDYVLRLCSQLKVFKVNCISKNDGSAMKDAKEWEEHLSHISFSTKIEINVCKISNEELMDLTGYNTEFWTKRHLTAIKSTDKIRSNDDVDENEHTTSLLIV